ncbi:MAG: hypothetical protein IPL13_01930 [Saprospiraceae bacterium]|nr:hypothetical protein [Candidatus Brachybacter algidus]
MPPETQAPGGWEGGKKIFPFLREKKVFLIKKLNQSTFRLLGFLNHHHVEKIGEAKRRFMEKKKKKKTPQKKTYKKQTKKKKNKYFFPEIPINNNFSLK